jgi:hypothetical protein
MYSASSSRLENPKAKLTAALSFYTAHFAPITTIATILTGFYTTAMAWGYLDNFEGSIFHLASYTDILQFAFGNFSTAVIIVIFLWASLIHALAEALRSHVGLRKWSTLSFATLVGLGVSGMFAYYFGLFGGDVSRRFYLGCALLLGMALSTAYAADALFRRELFNLPNIIGCFIGLLGVAYMIGGVTGRYKLDVATLYDVETKTSGTIENVIIVMSLSRSCPLHLRSLVS